MKLADHFHHMHKLHQAHADALDDGDVHKAFHQKAADHYKKCHEAVESDKALVPTDVHSVAPDNRDAMQRLADRGMRLVRRDGGPTFEEIGIGSGQAALEAEVQTVDPEFQKLVSSE